MMRRLDYTPYLVLALSLTMSASAWAQEPTAQPQEAAPAQADAQAQPTQAPASMSLSVEVMRGGANAGPLQGAPVILRAARPKGPFEPTDPTPVHEWTGVTDANGVATFEGVPADLTSKGLRLHAVTLYEGVSYKSNAAIPVQGMKLRLPVFEKTGQVELVQIDQLRLIIEPSEGYLIFSQTLSVSVSGDKALSTSLLAGEQFAKGLPFELPLKAQGINVFGPGQHKTINSTVYWTGEIKPGEPLNLQVRYSIPANDERFIYEQRLDYPVKQADIVVPIQTQFRKIPRLNALQLAALGFDAKVSTDVPGIKPGVETLYAVAQGPLAAQSTIKLQLKGLPFKRSQAPWVVLLLGLLGAGGAIWLARKESAAARAKLPVAQLRMKLNKERESLFEELVALELDFDRELLTAREYEVERMAISERLALIMRKLKDLDQAPPEAAAS